MKDSTLIRKWKIVDRIILRHPYYTGESGLTQKVSKQLLRLSEDALIFLDETIKNPKV
jgi:hypothetical protein